MFILHIYFYSAGVGRTGTIMLIDLTLRMAAEEGFIDILGIFQKLRQQRINMVDRPVILK